MRLRTIALCGFFVCAALGGAKAADEPSAAHLEAARELVVASGALSGLDRVIPALLSEVRRQSVTRPEIAKDLDEVLKSLTPELEQQRLQGIQIAARTYARYLPEADIRQAIAFFKSPAGARYVLAQPDVTEDVVNDITAWSQIIGEYIQTRVRAEMLKRGFQLQ